MEKNPPSPAKLSINAILNNKWLEFENSFKDLNCTENKSCKQIALFSVFDEEFCHFAFLN